MRGGCGGNSSYGKRMLWVESDYRFGQCSQDGPAAMDIWTHRAPKLPHESVQVKQHEEGQAVNKLGKKCISRKKSLISYRANAVFFCFCWHHHIF